MIEFTATRQCVGQVGINHGPLFPEQELGWLLYDGHEGHGYATEAAAALRDWAFATLKLPSLVSYMAPDNAMSAAVAKRLGGMLDPSAPRADPDDLVYRYRALSREAQSVPPSRHIRHVVQLVGIASHVDRSDPFVFDLQGRRLNNTVLDRDEARQSVDDGVADQP